MKPSIAANLSLILVVIGWPLVIYGFGGQLGDLPNPSVPPEKIQAYRQWATFEMFLGLFALLAALWLSGVGFHGAMVRSGISALACVLPVAVWVSILWLR